MGEHERGDHGGRSDARLDGSHEPPKPAPQAAPPPATTGYPPSRESNNPQADGLRRDILGPEEEEQARVRSILEAQRQAQEKANNDKPGGDHPGGDHPGPGAAEGRDQAAHGDHGGHGN